jgi:hypothetical protein
LGSFRADWSLGYGQIACRNLEKKGLVYTLCDGVCDAVYGMQMKLEKQSCSLGGVWLDGGASGWISRWVGPPMIVKALGKNK